MPFQGNGVDAFALYGLFFRLAESTFFPIPTEAGFSKKILICSALSNEYSELRYASDSLPIPCIYYAALNRRLEVPILLVVRLTRRSDCANQPHEGVDLLRNSGSVGPEVLLQANSAKERDD